MLIRQKKTRAATTAPKRILAKLKRKAAAYYVFQNLSLKRAKFAIWRRYSKARFGDYRPIIAHGKEIIVRTDDWRGFWLHETGGTQKELIKIWKELIQLNPEVCLDIGANYGEFSVVANNSDSYLIAIEANPIVYECLKRTFRSYPEVTLLNVAVSNSKQPLTLYITKEMSGYSSLAEGRAQPDLPLRDLTKTVSEVEVESQTIDSILLKILVRRPVSALLKIDIEGFEDKALLGAKQTLEMCTWWRALLEFSQSAIRRRGADPAIVWDWMRSDYRGVIISGDVINSFSDLTECHLPKNPPEYCNILIGQGAIP